MRCHDHVPDRRHLGERSHQLPVRRRLGHQLGVGCRSLDEERLRHPDEERPDVVRHLGHLRHLDGLGHQHLDGLGHPDGCPDLDDPCPD